jgi:hypothetical protein
VYPTCFSSLIKLTLGLGGLLLVAAIGSGQTGGKGLPPGITDIMGSPANADATWALLAKGFMLHVSSDAYNALQQVRSERIVPLDLAAAMILVCSLLKVRSH